MAHVAGRIFTSHEYADIHYYNGLVNITSSKAQRTIQ